MRAARWARPLAETECDAGFVLVVGGHLHFDAVANDESNEAFAHFTGDVSEDFVPVLELDFEHGAGKNVGDRAFHFDFLLAFRTRLFSGSRALEATTTAAAAASFAAATATGAAFFLNGTAAAATRASAWTGCCSTWACRSGTPMYCLFFGCHIWVIET